MTKTLKNNKKGFTLTELIIVIVIIGILAAVLIPSLSNYIQKAKKSAAEQDALTIYQQYLSTVDNEDYADIATLNFVVESNGYYVLIENGALKDSFKTSDRDVYQTVDTSAAQADIAISDVTTDVYVLLTSGSEYVKATQDGKLFNAKLITISKTASTENGN